MNWFNKIFPDPLLFYLVVAIFLAYFFPEISLLTFNQITLDNIINIGVLAVFFFYGLKLKWNEVFKDLINWKLHLRVQLITFLIFPLIGLCIYPISKIDPSFYSLFLAIFYLCALPSTVSSSVVMVSLAKGNVTSAIFNASLSGLIGILLTPLWMSLFIKSNTDVDSTSIFVDLLYKVLLPVVLGAILQPWLGKYYTKYKDVLVNVDKLTIVLIVFTSFSHNFLNGYFSTMSSALIMLCIVLVIFLFFVIFYLTQFLNNKFWHHNKADFITLQFCGTKKSLVHGSVMGSVIFGNDIGMFLLPIMLYHTFQLIFISYKSTQYAKEME